MHLSCQFLQLRGDTRGEPIAERDVIGETRLILAFCGRHRFHRTRWTEHCLRYWVLDTIVQGRQMQRIGDLPAFERTDGMLALYAPHTFFYEQLVKGQTLTDAYLIFDVRGAIDAMLRSIVGPRGYCHFDDPGDQVIDPLQRLGRRYLVCDPAADVLTHGLMLTCIGSLAASTLLAPGRRVLSVPVGAGEDLLRRSASFLEANLDRPVRVSDLAAALGMSTSALAHAYPRAAGETPHRAILRYKINAAKRLLLSKGLNVQETAERLGFSSAFNFSRAFKRVEGCPPREYLANHI